MSAPSETTPDPDRDLIKSVWTEARDLIKRLEGTTVQRFAVAAGDYKIEIERAAPAPAAVAGEAGGAGAAPTLSGGPVAIGAGPGPGVAPGARGMSGVFTIGGGIDLRIPVLAPLVGTYYSAEQPGSKPFVTVGDTVDAGQPVCIVEAMKLMNEVVANDTGKVAEIMVENGQWVEFEQVLMYLEPAEG
jgi:acetyl-CoA carboxylase biotin carboxyl carrier protein